MSVPALERGLRIIEKVASSRNGMSFGELAGTFAIANASLARLLNCLQEMNYLKKDDQKGLYVPGDNIVLFGKPTSIQEILQERSGAILEQLKKSTANTAILFSWTGTFTLCLNKALDENMLGMQTPGMMREDILNYPWGWLFYFDLSGDEKAIFSEKSGVDEGFEESLEEHHRFYIKNGFTIDSSGLLKRLAAPIFDKNGNTVAAVALGGNPLTIPDSKDKVFGKLLADSARELSSLIRHR